MSEETAKCNDQPASERSCPDPSGSVFSEPTDKDYKRTMLLGILAEFAESPTPDKYTDVADRIVALFSQNVEDWHPSLWGSWFKGFSDFRAA